MLLVELTQQEHLNVSSGLFLVAVELGREHLCVVEDEGVLVVEVVDDVLEDAVLNFTSLAVQHHEPCLVAIGGGVHGDELTGHVVVKFR